MTGVEPRLELAVAAPVNDERSLKKMGQTAVF